MNLIDMQHDQEFMDKLADATTVEAVKELLNAKGVDMSDEEITQALAQADQELTEGDLEKVAGGFGSILAGVAVLVFLIGVARGARCKK